MSCAREMAKLERQFVARSSSAFVAAWRNMQASGQSTVISEGGALYRVRPDGGRKLIEQIEPPTKVKRGQKVKIA